MNNEINAILQHLETDDREISRLKNEILALDISRPTALESMIEYLYTSIDQGIKKHDYVGYYYFFLSCIYYEKGEFVNATQDLESRIPQLWETDTNKSLAHWLLGSAN
jgi:hypothetical protein